MMYIVEETRSNSLNKGISHGRLNCVAPGRYYVGIRIGTIVFIPKLKIIPGSRLKYMSCVTYATLLGVS
jgi:hypothetical protein